MSAPIRETVSRLMSRLQDPSSESHANRSATEVRESLPGAKTGLRIRTISRLDEASSLRADWETLYERSPGASAAQSYDFVTAAWELIERHQRGRVVVVVATEGDDLVCVAPLWLRTEGSTLVAGTLGSGSREEYAEPLLADLPGKALIAAGVVEHAAPLADVLRLTNIPASSPFVAVLSRSRRYAHQTTAQSPVASLRGASSWEDWLASKSSRFRRRNRQEWNKLAKVGELTTSRGRTSSEARAIVDWVFDTKARWLAERSISHSWLLDDHGRQLFKSLASSPETSCVNLVALQVDGRFVAASVGLHSRDRIEGLVTSYDPDFAAFSPGLVLVQAVVRDAYESGLDFDFRLPIDEYKMRWADRVDDYVSFDIASSAKGVRYVARLQLRHVGSSARHRVMTLSQVVSPQGYAAARSGKYSAVPLQLGRDLGEHARRLRTYLRDRP